MDDTQGKLSHEEPALKREAASAPTHSSIRAELVLTIERLRSLKEPETDHLWRKLAVRDIRQAIRWIDEAELSSEEEAMGQSPAPGSARQQQ